MMENNNLIYGFMHTYNPETETTSVSWTYKDDPRLEYFVLETYNEITREWEPYDGRMGIIEKER